MIRKRVEHNFGFNCDDEKLYTNPTFWCNTDKISQSIVEEGFDGVVR